VRMLRRGETARPVCAAACILLVLLLLYHSSGAVAMLGRIKEVGNVSNSLEIDELAKFAVDEHNGRENSLDKLSFCKVVSARTQVVQGTMYHLTIEVQEGGNPKLYDAKVWVKPWENFKKLEEFKPAVTPSTFTSADLGTRTGTWPVHLFACVQVVIFSGPGDLQ
jgi:flavin-binding protein dodecin